MSLVCYNNVCPQNVQPTILWPTIIKFVLFSLVINYNRCLQCCYIINETTNCFSEAFIYNYNTQNCTIQINHQNITRSSSDVSKSNSQHIVTLFSSSLLLNWIFKMSLKNKQHLKHKIFTNKSSKYIKSKKWYFGHLFDFV